MLRTHPPYPPPPYFSPSISLKMIIWDSSLDCYSFSYFFLPLVKGEGGCILLDKPHEANIRKG
jgi:hypothetical protein